MKKMKLFLFVVPLACAVSAWAAPQGDVHVAVYSTGFLVDTEREVTYGNGARRLKIKTSLQGTAQGEASEISQEIDRVDLGKLWILDPNAKTYVEQPYLRSFVDSGSPATERAGPVTLKITRLDPTIRGPLGSATINGYPSQSYTIRIVADFTDTGTGKVVATETLLEKLWVTEKAPALVQFQTAQENFFDSLNAVHGTEKATFRWLLREFNKSILESNGNRDDFKSLQMTYQGARASIKGVTVRRLVGWSWQSKDPSAPGAQAADDINALVGAIAAGLGAPPIEEGKAPLADAKRPKWVQELEKDLGRSGPSAMMLEEVFKARNVTVSPDFFEIPSDYRKEKGGNL